MNEHISDCQDCKKPDNQKLIRLSTYITVVGVCTIIVAKLYGWYISESVTILASLTDSLLDICVSIMNLLAVHYALQPPDHEHRFGHGKAEDIAVFSQAAFFFLSGLFIIGKSIERIFNPNDQIVSFSSEAVNILLFSIAITTIIVIFQRYVMKHSKSHIIEADSMHYLTDFLTNIGAIIGILITSYWNILMFDSLTAIAIAIYIIINSIRMFKRALNNLMDHELAEEDRQKIIEIIKSHKEALGFHDLKTRYAGVKPFIQFHLELDEDMPLKQAHDISHNIETAILNIIPNADIIIHQDPEGANEEVSYKD